MFPDTHIYGCVIKGKKYYFSEYFAYVLNEWSLVMPPELNQDIVSTCHGFTLLERQL